MILLHPQLSWGLGGQWPTMWHRMEEEEEGTEEGRKLCGGCQPPEAGHQGTAQPRVPATPAPSAPVSDSLSLFMLYFLITLW